MIVNERMVTFINSLDRGNTGLLGEIERQAVADRVPIIRQEMQSFLKMFLALKEPERILEVGTAVGFSALLMAEHTSPECRITTIEGTPWIFFGSWRDPTILFLWMRPRGSTFISFRRP